MDELEHIFNEHLDDLCEFGDYDFGSDIYSVTFKAPSTFEVYYHPHYTDVYEAQTDDNNNIYFILKETIK